MEECKVAIEYDGRWHEEPSQRQRDHERRRRITGEGWRFVVVTAEQLATDFASILEAVRTAQRAQLAG
ncbi:hypothetical protein GCM10023192_45010 [Amycolatopsis samaneae]